MIANVYPLPVGNALRLFLNPPPNARRWRLLRKDSDTFSGENDVAALVVHDGDERVVLDRTSLNNGATYFYRAYYFDGSAWAASGSVAASPSATYEGAGQDVLELLRERIDLGLQVEIARATLRPQSGRIHVLTAPPQEDKVTFPVVSVHLNAETPEVRALGETVDPDEFDGEDWTEGEGWYASTDIAVIGWSLNPDERISLRKALRRVIQANLPVFDDAGLVQVNVSLSDAEELERFNAPMYMVQGRFTCLAPYTVVDAVDAIDDVEVDVTVSPSTISFRSP